MAKVTMVGAKIYSVELTREEWEEAACVGILRQIEAVSAGKKDRFGFEGIGWDIHIEGACGEKAAAEVLQLEWSQGINTYALPDVGKFQVRTRSVNYYGLLVRPTDKDEESYILVVGKSPKFRVYGWMTGAEAKQAKWLDDKGDRDPAYFVPQEELHPMTGLMVTDRQTEAK